MSARCSALLCVALVACSHPVVDEPAAVERPSIVLIVLDALRADHLSVYGYPRATSPHLERLREDGVLFRRAYAAAPTTLPSVAQMLTSSYFPDTYRHSSWIDVALAAGYETSAAIVNNPWAGKWVAHLEPTFGTVTTGAFSATAITDKALAWLDANRARSVVTYLHYLDTHTPYQAPEKFVRSFIDDAYAGSIGLRFHYPKGVWTGEYDTADRQRIVDLYDAAVAYTDFELGRLFDGMREHDLYEDSLIVVTADHGEEFWEHGSVFHGQSLYEELLHVPLVVKFPRGWGAGREVSEAVSTVDILPTLAELMLRQQGSTDAIDDGWAGTSLIGTVRGDDAPRGELFATVARTEARSPPRHALLEQGRYKYIRNVDDSSEELYDLVHDPAETDDLSASQNAAVIDRMRARLAAYTARLWERGYKIEVRNAGTRTVRYELQVAAQPPAPLASVDSRCERGSATLGVYGNGTGLLVSGTLAPGDEGRFRFDLLRGDGALHLVARLDGAPWPAGDVLIGRRALPAATYPSGVPVDSDALDGVPEIATAPRAPTVRLWRIGGVEHAAPATLTAAERERLQALGYLR